MWTPIRSLARKFRAARLARHAFRGNQSPILIYQMGKVGSSSVYHSLIREGIPNPLLHLHFLSADLFRHKNSLINTGVIPLPFHILVSEAVHHELTRDMSLPVKIISLVRDPVAQVISSLFQVPEFAGDTIRGEDGLIDVQKAATYLEQKLARDDSFTYINDWFDNELKSVFDIDVFARPFSRKTGYSIYTSGNIEALIIRMEDLSEKGPQAIADFLGLNMPLDLQLANSREETDDKQLYRAVRDKVKIDMAACNRIYNSRFTRHFYNDAMIQGFIRQWTRGN